MRTQHAMMSVTNTLLRTDGESSAIQTFFINSATIIDTTDLQMYSRPAQHTVAYAPLICCMSPWIIELGKAQLGCSVVLAGLTPAPVSDGDLTHSMVGWWLAVPGSHVTTTKSFWTCFYGGHSQVPRSTKQN